MGAGKGHGTGKGGTWVQGREGQGREGHGAGKGGAWDREGRGMGQGREKRVNRWTHGKGEYMKVVAGWVST